VPDASERSVTLAPSQPVRSGSRGGSRIRGDSSSRPGSCSATQAELGDRERGRRATTRCEAPHLRVPIRRPAGPVGCGRVSFHSFAAPQLAAPAASSSTSPWHCAATEMARTVTAADRRRVRARVAATKRRHPVAGVLLAAGWEGGRVRAAPVPAVVRVSTSRTSTCRLSVDESRRGGVHRRTT